METEESPNNTNATSDTDANKLGVPHIKGIIMPAKK